jgi:hypothetical protein
MRRDSGGQSINFRTEASIKKISQMNSCSSPAISAPFDENVCLTPMTLFSYSQRSLAPTERALCRSRMTGSMLSAFFVLPALLFSVNASARQTVQNPPLASISDHFFSIVDDSSPEDDSLADQPSSQLPAQQRAPQTRRILGIIPNFRSISSDEKLPPQSVKD